MLTNDVNKIKYFLLMNVFTALIGSHFWFLFVHIFYKHIWIIEQFGFGEISCRCLFWSFNSRKKSIGDVICVYTCKNVIKLASDISIWHFLYRPFQPADWYMFKFICLTLNMKYVLNILKVWAIKFWSRYTLDIPFYTCRRSKKMSRDMTKPTKWVCAQQRLRSAWACANLNRVFAVRSLGS